MPTIYSSENKLPRGSLIWPLLPHLVWSSTGLNHSMSSETKPKTSFSKKIILKWNKIIIHLTEFQDLASHFMAFQLTMYY